MGRVALTVLLAALSAMAAGQEDGGSRAPPTVSIKAGSLSGTWLSARNGRDIAAFNGIPYAAPPVGKLRFKAAQPAEPWTGVRQAVQPASKCIQRDVYLHEKEVSGSEDCLYINVYVPDVSRPEPLPVLFWIHGGGWLSGTGSLYTPEYLLEKDVVLVTFNYRLGPLGFLSTGDDVIPGNNGLKDMVFALRWVRDNIRAFGGNPDSVTIFGQSAGGASTHLLTLSPLSKGLFHRALAMSGNAFAPWAFQSPALAKSKARVLAQHTGCPEAPSDALLRCLRSKAPEDIVSVDERFIQWDIHPHMPFRCTVEVGGDEPFMDLHPRDAYGAGYLHDEVPFMTGLTAQDGAIFCAAMFSNTTMLRELDQDFTELSSMMHGFDHYPELMRRETFDRVRQFYFGDGSIDENAAFNLIEMYTDSLFLYPTTEVIKIVKRYTKAPVFFYLFAHLSQSHRSFTTLFGAPSADYGVCHSDDLMYVFPMTFLPGELATDDVHVSRKYIEYIVHFARTGRPTPDKTWQEVAHPDAAEYMHIGSPGDIQIRANLAAKRMKLWSEVPIRIGRVTVAHDEL
ncbi:hypothetical protein ONE63_007231 [Megalurothrips usitatus]|uniref:Carboxylic ester hydrolase n=1 Tax=Megalurothrips usitatus TaxID=439358 RepID=A0AAV7XVH5_9NEOP|nr:hypothetical protein ONE63_007231 [Megalurothrips usitatus]